jgi:ubiquinone/menaquinone biosynthesis C-methylase UbiE
LIVRNAAAAPKDPVRNASFDRLAGPYRWLEYLSFGRALERCRFSFLHELGGARRVLLYGDGDGRFLHQLLLRYPALEVDAVDSSVAMLRAAEARLPAACRSHVRFHHADARTFTPPAGPYDLVITHFFLDCFTADELRALIGRIRPHLAPQARWLVSEFAIPQGRFSALAGRVVVSLLYFAFRVLTGLRVTRLPDYPALLAANGFALLHSTTLLRGLLRSELWSQTHSSRSSC